TKYVLGKAELTGDAVRRGTARLNQGGGWEVLIDFKAAGAAAWETFTGRLACEQGVTRQIAIVLDGVVESSPQVNEDIVCNEGITGGTTVITGDFTEEEAKDLAVVLTAGALPVELEQSEVRQVSATLGRDSLRAGLLAGVLGLALVLLYVLIYYRALGLQTWFGLLVFAAITYGLVVLFGEWIGWSLTLAGIAGLIVSIGVATDSYIVFFERVKEEIHEGRSLRASIDRGFHHAWRTMLAANTVTILAALVLYVLAVGPVRGFALALGMATVLDLGVTYGLTWPVAALLAQNRFFAENPVIGMRRALEGGKREGPILRKIYRSEFNIDFIGRRRIGFTLSAILLIVSALALIPGIRGLNYSIDFRGGTIYRAPAPNTLSVPEVRDALSQSGLENPLVQIVRDPTTGRSQVQVQSSSSLAPEEREAVAAALARVTGARPNEVDTEAIGQRWGGQITAKALRALAIFLVLAIIYMSLRLEPKMAAAGIVALLHDLAITAGIYALVGFEVSPATVIATLTILGYSLYDTVVVFDKIHEYQQAPGSSRKPFGELANASLNQVLMRSISTSLTVLLPVGSLLFVGSLLLGAETLKDLALALFVGVALGAYSTIFVATPLLSIWKERESRYVRARPKRARPAAKVPVSEGNGRRGAKKATPRPASVGTGYEADVDAEPLQDEEEAAPSPRLRSSGRGGASTSTVRADGEPRRSVSTQSRAGGQRRRNQSRAKRKKARR
ncbi:MAG: protein translocase subunit SecF, partial [Actinomycetota bacterium]|nr:protein translocase subunit SecF [Actinomycetota bacterium]